VTAHAFLDQPTILAKLEEVLLASHQFARRLARAVASDARYVLLAMPQAVDLADHFVKQRRVTVVCGGTSILSGKGGSSTARVALAEALQSHAAFTAAASDLLALVGALRDQVDGPDVARLFSRLDFNGYYTSRTPSMAAPANDQA